MFWFSVWILTSFIQSDEPEVHDNEMFAHDEDMSPYVTSEDVGAAAINEIKGLSSYQSGSSLPVGEGEYYKYLHM